MSRGLGRLQRKALLVLWRADGHRVAVGELKRMVGGDRGNSRRAIRTLINRGLVEEVGEGNLIKLTAPAMYALVIAEHFGDLSEEWVPHYSLDLDAVLAAAEDEPAWEPHANAVTPCKRRLFPETRVSDNLGNPYGSREPSWFRELRSDLLISDNAGEPHESLDTSWITAQLGDPPVRDNGPATTSLASLISDALEGHRDTEGESE